VGVDGGGGEGGIREVEKDYGGDSFMHSRGGRTGSIGTELVYRWIYSAPGG
jgi:hypothetical protein